MNLPRAARLALIALTACEPAPSPSSAGDAGATTDGSADDGGGEEPEGLSIDPEPIGAVPLTAAAFEGIVPPSWHVGETWEVMFCIAGDEWTSSGKYDTTRVVFKVVAVPEPGAYVAVVEATKHTFPHVVWVDEEFEVNGVLGVRGQNHVVEEEHARYEMRFAGGSFKFMYPSLYNVEMRFVLPYQRVGEHLSTYSIVDFTPHVPVGLCNPEVTAPTNRSVQVRSTITPTSDGLVYQAEERADSVLRRTVIWNRGESWWSFAREEVIGPIYSADPDRNEVTGLNGDTTITWAVKLPPDQPESVNCNSKH